MDMLGTSQIAGFQPCHILKGWNWARHLPVLPPLFLPGMGRGGAASPTSWAEISALSRVYAWVGGSPPKE